MQNLILKLKRMITNNESRLFTGLMVIIIITGAIFHLLPAFDGEVKTQGNKTYTLQAISVFPIAGGDEVQKVFRFESDGNEFEIASYDSAGVEFILGVYDEN